MNEERQNFCAPFFFARSRSPPFFCSLDDKIQLQREDFREKKNENNVIRLREQSELLLFLSLQKIVSSERRSAFKLEEFN